jgi:hypothetical protein
MVVEWCWYGVAVMLVLCLCGKKVEMAITTMVKT